MDVEKDCFNCKHSLKIDGYKTIRTCDNWRSGCFDTDVTDAEVCNGWEAQDGR